MSFKKIIVKSAILIVSFIVAIPINATIFEFFVSPNTAEISFENKSKVQVESIEIQLCTEIQHATAVESGKTVSFKFNISGDCHFSIKALLEGGRLLSDNFGYVTNGSNFKTAIAIEDTQLVEEKQTVEPDPNYFIKTVGLFLFYVLITFILYKLFIGLLNKIRLR